MSNIILRNATCTAEVQLFGAEIVSFKGTDGREVLWTADPAYWASHAPVLFPVCGSVPDNRIRIAGETWPMTKHGFCRKTDFSVYEQQEDKVDLVLGPTEQSRTMYPFDFEFHVIYTLIENGYTTTFRVVNLSKQVMPFCVGGHPGFNVPMEDGVSYDDYQIVFEQTEDGLNLTAPNGYLISGSEYLECFRNTDTLPLTHSLFDDRDALIFGNLKSRSVKLVNRNTGKGLGFAFPDMEVLAIWSKPKANAPYVCLEPWHGMPSTTDESGDFETKAFVTLLQPGCDWHGSFTVSLI